MRLTKVLFSVALISLFTFGTAFKPASKKTGEWFFWKIKELGSRLIMMSFILGIGKMMFASSN
jgi:hypothetical protein